MESETQVPCEVTREKHEPLQVALLGPIVHESNVTSTQAYLLYYISLVLHLSCTTSNPMYNHTPSPRSRRQLLQNVQMT